MTKFKKGDRVIGIFTVCKDTHEGKIHLIDGTITSVYNEFYTVSRIPQKDVIFVPEYNLLTYSEEMWNLIYVRYMAYNRVIDSHEKLIRDLFSQRR